MYKLNFLDSLRGYAILGVILTHTTRHFHGHIPEAMYNIGIQGSRGVQLFFIVSAFTLFYSLELYTQNQKFLLSHFYTKRFFRIAPMFYSALLFYISFNFVNEYLNIQSSYPIVSFTLILSTITFTNVLHPDWLFSLVPGGWSISNEFLFYLCIPILFRWIRTLRQASIVLVSSILISILLHLTLKHIEPFSEVNSYLFYWFPNQLPIFLMGIVLYFIWKKYKFKSVQTYSMTAISIIILFFLSLTSYDMTAVYPKHILFGLVFCIFALGISTVQKTFINHRFIQLIGTISFSVYLVHFFVLDVVIHFSFETLSAIFAPWCVLLIIFFTTTFFSILISLCTYRMIESPGIRFGKSLIQSHRNKNASSQKII